MIKRFIFLSVTLFIIIYLFSGCATFVGGSKYNAHVTVTNDPKAKIYFYNEFKGEGKADFKIRRKDANMVSIKVEKEGCKEQYYNFKKRKFRSWTLVGSIAIVPPFLINGIPIFPMGVFTDIWTGAYWKPYAKEPGISKINFNNYKYQLDYSGCISITEKDSLNINLSKTLPHLKVNKYSIFYFDEHFQSFDNYYDSLITVFKRDPSVLDMRIETNKYSDGNTRSVGLKANHIYNKNPEYNYKIGTWRFYRKNGQLEKAINYDLEENIINEKSYDKEGKLISNSNGPNNNTSSDKININSIIVTTDDNRYTCEIYNQDDNYVYFKLIKSDNIVVTYINKSQIKEIIKIYQ